MKPREISHDLVAKLQEIKAPLDEQRTQKQVEYGQLKEGLRVEIKDLHAKIAPIDDLLSQAYQLRKLSGRPAELLAEEIEQKIKELN